ncbi:MAG: GAF domain-containing protein [Myxococcales bacterium]|nr:GAF domain-containing protein [Myxococcales bacterium]MCB9546037.1 GAF domain-containing protein [Myxococcales bacterium]
MDTATDFSRVDLLLYLTERLESGTQAGIQDALALATRMLQMKFGIISKVVGDDYLVERVAPADGELQQGQRFSLGQTFCCNTLKANDVVSISDADTEAWRGHPCYTELGVGSYIGVPLRVGGRARGTLNFSGPTAREEPWADSDRQLVRLLGHWVEAALEQEELRRQVNTIVGALADSNRDLRGSRRAREALLAALPDPILVLDRAGRCVRCQLPPDAPLKRSAVEQQPLDHFLPPDAAARLRDAARRASGTGKLEVTELVLPWGDGDRVFEARVAPVDADDGSGQVTVVVLRDLTDREEARRLALQQRDLQHANDRLRAANEELETFAYAASHDLKTPLRALSSISTWIDEELRGAGEPQLQTYLGMMRDRVDLLVRLVDGLLAYSRIGREEAAIERIETRTLVAEIVGLLAPPAGFCVEADAGLPVLQTARPPLERVLANAIANAVHHHDHGTGLIRVTATTRGHLVEFRVADDGPGVPEEFRQQAFGVFKRLRRNDRGPGTGLGLALIRKTVESLGGTTWLEPNRPRGTVLVFTWPIRWPKGQVGSSL